MKVVRDEWGYALAQGSNDSNVVHQNFHAAVGNVAGRESTLRVQIRMQSRVTHLAAT